MQILRWHHLFLISAQGGQVNDNALTEVSLHLVDCTMLLLFC